MHGMTVNFTCFIAVVRKKKQDADEAKWLSAQPQLLHSPSSKIVEQNRKIYVKPYKRICFSFYQYLPMIETHQTG